jgi:hypothetical protein
MGATPGGGAQACGSAVCPASTASGAPADASREPHLARAVRAAGRCARRSCSWSCRNASPPPPRTASALSNARSSPTRLPGPRHPNAGPDSAPETFVPTHRRSAARCSGGPRLRGQLRQNHRPSPQAPRRGPLGARLPYHAAFLASGSGSGGHLRLRNRAGASLHHSRAKSYLPSPCPSPRGRGEGTVECALRPWRTLLFQSMGIDQP